MIRTALEFIKKELDAYIADREQDPAQYSAGSIVDLKPVALPNGNVNITDTTHITLMLAGVEEERREGKRPYYMPTDDKQFITLNPPVELDLFLLFAAHNGNYETALRDLSSIVSFFQANSIFDDQKYPALNATVADPVNKPWQLIERLSFRLYGMSFEQQNNLWSMLGTKYIPSVMYKVNMLTIFDNKAKGKSPAVKEFKIAEN
jgi:Pvc16 N-terminal domain